MKYPDIIELKSTCSLVRMYRVQLPGCQEDELIMPIFEKVGKTLVMAGYNRVSDLC